MSLYLEKQLANKIIDDTLLAGCSISVNDGEETTLVRSKDKRAILAAMFSTDEDVLIIYDDKDHRLGWVQLIYGNGADAISDYSVKLETLLAGANALANEMSE